MKRILLISVILASMLLSACGTAITPAPAPTPTPTAPTPTYTLSVNISPSGAGSVSPPGGKYESGLQVILTATPASGNTFDYWDGAASGSSHMVTITMNSNKSTTAHFKVVATPRVPTPTPAPTPALDIKREKMIEIFKANALAEWGGDYEMVNYTVKNQTQAYDWVVSQTAYPDIMERAKQEWQNDYEMVKYTYENQVEAYEWIMRQTAYPDIMERAKQEWGEDYEMVKYEYENQVEAYKALQ